MVVCGVAANSRLRERFPEAGNGLEVLVPPPVLCTDNAAMIAVAGEYLFREGRRDGLSLMPFALALNWRVNFIKKNREFHDRFIVSKAICAILLEWPSASHRGYFPTILFIPH